MKYQAINFLTGTVFFCGLLAMNGVVLMAEETTLSIEQIDKNLAAKPADSTGMVWFTPNESNIEVDGFAWYNNDNLYYRLPAEEAAKVSEGVSHLAKHTAGGQLRFRSDCRKLAITVDLGTLELMAHMAPTGSSGFDLYIGEPGKQRFYTSSRPNIYGGGSPTFSWEFFTFPDSEPRQMREYTLNFPLYNSVKSISLGVDAGSRVEPPTPYVDNRPIVVYGTSITQGGCASRPGMAYTNILSRRMNRPFYNFGFSGNGKGEPAMAEILASIENPAMFILDYEANAMGVIDQTLPDFISILRAKHPETPILVVSGIRFSYEATGTTPGEDNPRSENYQKWRDIQEQNVVERREQGDKNIYFFDGGYLLPLEYYDEVTVDGIHPTDLGFLKMAEALEPAIADILNGKAE